MSSPGDPRAADHFDGCLVPLVRIRPGIWRRMVDLCRSHVLLCASQIFDIVSGAAGSRWFGGTKWGATGAILGAIVGLFFMPFGLILGPLIGAYAFEIVFAKQEAGKAAMSGFGSAVGTLSSIVVKVIVGVMMIVWFLVDVFFIGA